MSENWNERFAFYAVALYRVGDYTDAALVGSVMFEKAVYDLLKRKGIEKDYINKNKGSKGPLQYAIDLMCKKYPKFNLNELDGIRRNVRNDITHEIDINEIGRDKIQPMLMFIWEALDELSYKEYDGRIDKIDFLTADYAVVDIREKFNENLQDILAKEYKFDGFKEKDFQELYELRNKMISLGSRIKKEILKIDYKNELFIDLISKIDTTSAYIWMSMNLRNGERERINSASASILGTPLDLRIYFDIGGGAYHVREDYYKFLQSDHFDNFKNNFNPTDIEIFSNDWYCFIVDRAPLSELSREDLVRKAREAEKKLADYNEHSKISWNRMLCGYIIKRGDISFEDIKGKLDMIIQLYYCFEHYRQHELKRKEIVFKVNIADKCRKHTNPTTFYAKSLNIKGLK